MNYKILAIKKYIKNPKKCSDAAISNKSKDSKVAPITRGKRKTNYLNIRDDLKETFKSIIRNKKSFTVINNIELEKSISVDNNNSLLNNINIIKNSLNKYKIINSSKNIYEKITNNNNNKFRFSNTSIQNIINKNKLKITDVNANELKYFLNEKLQFKHTKKKYEKLK